MAIIKILPANLSFGGSSIDLPVSVANGGTGQTSLTSGEILLGNGTSGITSTATLPITKGGTGGATATAARTNLAVMTQTVLYSNASGSDSTIELNDSIANYDHIGVYYYSEATVTGCSFYTEFPSSQSSVVLCAVRSNDGRTALLCKSVKTEWSTNTVTFIAPTEVQIKTTSVTFEEAHGIKIFKVVGYNY